jgi:hypothetical protein
MCGPLAVKSSFQFWNLIPRPRRHAAASSTASASGTSSPLLGEPFGVRASLVDVGGVLDPLG